MTRSITLDRKGIRIDGQYRVLLCASLFYFRIPEELWTDRIHRLQETGYNCVDVYFPWNYHERAPGQWDFAGNRDAGRFLDMVAEAGLYVVARPGPYICSEWDGGAIPAWILASGMNIRENSEPFMGQVRAWYDRIVPLLAARQIDRGGTIILFQLDNELDFFDCPDPGSYIGSLGEMARRMGIGVPLFGCAGQGSASGATGFAPGVDVTYNFYPSPVDPLFDQRCRLVTRTLAAIDRPLLITETNREHALLRRELANGAKLLGAYNQVGGCNFGFTSSINNWGNPWPLSLIASDYNFHSMIDSAGQYGPEAPEGRLMRALIDALGESLAAAEIDESSSVIAECDFPTPGGTVPTLRLRDGGMLLCVANLSATEGRARVRWEGIEFAAVVGGLRSPLFPVDLSIGRTGVSGTILHSSAEVLVMEKGRLMLYADGPAEVALEMGDGKKELICSTAGPRVLSCAGRQLEVRILSRDEAVSFLFGRAWNAGVSSGTVSIAAGTMAAHEPGWAETVPAAGITMEARGLYRGFACYDTGSDAGTSLLLQGVADVITAFDGKRRMDTRVSAGQWQLYEGKSGRWRFITESWGHSNFDDSRLQSLRLRSSKGIAGMYQILREQSLAGQWRFRLMDRWLPPKLAYREHPFDPLLDTNSWNSTRRPLIALYSTDVAPVEGSDGLALRLEGNKAEAALYANGTLVGEFNPNDPWLFVSSDHLARGTARLELLCRKRDWSEPAGTATLYHVKRLQPTVRGFGEDQLAALRVVGGRELPLPMQLGRGGPCLVEFGLDALEHHCAYASFQCADLKLTAVFNGRIVGRIFGTAENRPFLTGGDSMKCYLPGPWHVDKGNRLVLFVEPIGERPELTALTVQYARS